MKTAAKQPRQRKKDKSLVEVQTLELREESERRVALAEVRIGPVEVKGISVWRSSSGHLRVYWPSYRPFGAGQYYLDAVGVNPDLRTEVEAAVVATYKAKKTEKKKR